MARKTIPVPSAQLKIQNSKGSISKSKLPSKEVVSPQDLDIDLTILKSDILKEIESKLGKI